MSKNLGFCGRNTLTWNKVMRQLKRGPNESMNNESSKRRRFPDQTSSSDCSFGGMASPPSLLREHPATEQRSAALHLTRFHGAKHIGNLRRDSSVQFQGGPQEVQGLQNTDPPTRWMDVRNDRAEGMGGVAELHHSPHPSPTPDNESPREKEVMSGFSQSPDRINLFSGAHNFKLDNPNFVERPTFIQSFIQADTAFTVISILDTRRVPGAEVDSSDRFPPPRCHPDTRQEIRSTLRTWLDNDNRFFNFLWLSGPAGVGKSAVAQTFAEHCRSHGRLGAAFFFSRLQGRTQARGVLPTICYQLAIRHAGYNHLITKALSNDPSILDKNVRIQFRKLLVEPMVALSRQDERLSRQPLVIIVDGLDECDDERAQQELIQLIGEHVLSGRSTRVPLLWLVVSRPEWHLKRVFARANPKIRCGREELSCDATKDIEDVYCILRDGLQEIHTASSWELGEAQVLERWPTETKLQSLSRRVGGLPILAETILRFIGGDSHSPNAQLDICLLFLDALGPLHLTVNPLDALDTFYRQILANIPPHILSTLKDILAFCVLLCSHIFRNNLHSSLDIARFLGLGSEEFYLALRSLHSVVLVPSIEASHRLPLRFYHQSFADFLQDPNRSNFFLDMEEAKYQYGVLFLRWRNKFIRAESRPKPSEHDKNDILLGDCQGWVKVLSDDDNRQSLSRIQEFTLSNLRYMFHAEGESQKTETLSEFYRFNWYHSRSSQASSNELVHSLLI